MADEWSKPVKGADGIWRSRENDSDGDLVAVNVNRVEIIEAYDQGGAPRDVVLRLLAAEASDRLGWAWEVGEDEFTGQLAAGRVDWPVLWLVFPDGSIASEANCACPDTPDELLAAMWGRFLLEDAIREAGR